MLNTDDMHDRKEDLHWSISCHKSLHNAMHNAW